MGSEIAEDEAFIRSFNALACKMANAYAKPKRSGSSAYTELLLAKIKQYRIEIRPQEQGHNIPHFHVSSSDWSASYRIDNLDCLAGCIPKRKHEKLLLDWARDNKKLLEKKWEDTRPTTIEQKITIIGPEQDDD